jgi:hypothetical protein
MRRVSTRSRMGTRLHDEERERESENKVEGRDVKTDEQPYRTRSLPDTP